MVKEYQVGKGKTQSSNSLLSLLTQYKLSPKLSVSLFMMSASRDSFFTLDVWMIELGHVIYKLRILWRHEADFSHESRRALSPTFSFSPHHQSSSYLTLRSKHQDFIGGGGGGHLLAILYSVTSVLCNLRHSPSTIYFEIISRYGS